MRVLILLALLTFAGCVAPADDVATEAPDAQFSEDRGRGNITVDVPTIPIEAPLPGERTAAEPPQLRLGEWWSIRLIDHFTYTEYNIDRIVAGTEHGNYLIGFPLDAFSNDALVMHTPGYGDVLPDLSYGAHDVPYVPLQFPLEEGNTWSTAWEAEGATMDMVVEEIMADGTVYIVGNPTGNGAYPTEIWYDPSIGEIRKQIMHGYAEWEVTNHGYGYTGDVRVPHAHDLVFLNGRVAGVMDISQGLSPTSAGSPLETITVGEGYDRISFAILMYDLPALVGQTDVPAGVYSVKATAPDGTVFEDTYTPADGNWIKATFFGHENPAGDWQLEAIAGGAGAAFIEGIGYHSIDIALPSGCVLASAAANHHGTLCADSRQSEGLPQ